MLSISTAYVRHMDSYKPVPLYFLLAPRHLLLFISKKSLSDSDVEVEVYVQDISCSGIFVCQLSSAIFLCTHPATYAHIEIRGQRLVKGAIHPLKSGDMVSLCGHGGRFVCEYINL